MDDSELCLTYRPDDDRCLGELTAAVRSGAFSGQGTAWFNRTEIEECLVAPLGTFPLSSTAPPKIEGGMGNDDDFRCHLRVMVKPYNSMGILLVHVDLVSDYWRQASIVDAPNSASIRFLTEYALVNTFAKELQRVLEGTKECAVLKGYAS
jgi:hypothetical protein